MVTENIDPQGWCSSCDAIRDEAKFDENHRPCCPECGDYLIFADDDEDGECLYVKTWGLP